VPCPDRWRSRRKRVPRLGRSGKRLVGNIDALRGIHGLGERFCDNDSNRLADISHDIFG
jgi:hypothetical protein